MYTSILEIVAQATPGTQTMSVLDVVLFCAAVVGVIGLGIYKARPKKVEGEAAKEKSAADYFLAGRGLSWWLIGFSLIAANISTEQFVGMGGQAADWLGMAIASYEWLAAITLVVVAFFFLPKLLRCGVYTIPEFLETRYNTLARTIMALCTLLILVGVPTAGVIYSGATVISEFFKGYELLGIDFSSITVGCIIIALCGAIYVFVGGLKACAWTDLIWGAGLIVGGGVVAYLCLKALGSAEPASLIQSASANSDLVKNGTESAIQSLKEMGPIDRLIALNSGDAVEGVNTVGGKLHMVRPATDPSIPWTALCLGLWIPNFFYWGLNQYIMQRTLAAKSLSEGQIGIVFAAFLKLIIPFVVVIPGILAYNLYRDDLQASAKEKHDKEINRIVTANETSSTIYFVTDNFLVNNPDLGAKYVRHNAELMQATPEVKTKIENAIVALEKDVADQSTTMAQRAPLVKEIADLNNNEFVKKAPTKNLKVSEKLVGFDYDKSFGTLLRNLLPNSGWTWFVLAALFGAVVSSLASMLNSASTIFTMDIYHKLRKSANDKELVFVGKIGILICVAIALSVAPFLGSPAFGGIFNFIQEFQGFISPGVLCVFLFGFFVPKCPRFFGWLGIAINAILYGALKWFIAPEMPFLNRMSICLGAIIVIGIILTAINAARGGEAVIVPSKNEVPLETSRKAKAFGAFVIVATVALYAIFW